MVDSMGEQVTDPRIAVKGQWPLSVGVTTGNYGGDVSSWEEAHQKYQDQKLRKTYVLDIYALPTLLTLLSTLGK